MITPALGLMAPMGHTLPRLAVQGAFPKRAKPASGLVSISTSDGRQSDTKNPNVFLVDADEARLRRMKRSVCKAAEVHQSAMQHAQGYAPAMVTLTYASMGDWHPRHLSAAVKLCREWLARRGHKMRYVWVAELQDRGAIHYHLITWFPCSKGGRKTTDTPPFWDAQGWWPHGHSQSAWADNPVGYIASYVTKINSKDRLPCGARMHGSGGFDLAQRARMAYHSRPTWVRDLSYIGQKIKRARGGGIERHFACGLSQLIRSPYVLLMRGKGRAVVARRDAPPEQVRQFLGDLWPQKPHPLST